jgi:hypothetical protein
LLQGVWGFLSFVYIPTRKRKKMNIINAVIRVLKDHQGPTHFRTIAKEIEERELIDNTNGQTMETLVNANVGIDIKTSENAGKLPRFQKLPNGFIALTESAYDVDLDEEDFNRDDEHDRSYHRDEHKHDRNNSEYHDLLQSVDDYKHSVSKDFCRYLNNIDFASFERMFNSLIRSFPIRRSTIVNRRKMVEWIMRSI